jgi:hypothetical protein
VILELQERLVDVFRSIWQQEGHLSLKVADLNLSRCIKFNSEDEIWVESGSREVLQWLSIVDGPEGSDGEIF